MCFEHLYRKQNENGRLGRPFTDEVMMGWVGGGSPILNVLVLFAACRVRLPIIVSPSAVQSGPLGPADPVLHHQSCSSGSISSPCWSGVCQPPRQQQQPRPARLRCLRPSPSPRVAVTPPAASGCGPPAAPTVSGRLHQACQALPRQWLALEIQFKWKTHQWDAGKYRASHRNKVPVI